MGQGLRHHRPFRWEPDLRYSIWLSRQQKRCASHACGGGGVRPRSAPRQPTAGVALSPRDTERRAPSSPYTLYGIGTVMGGCLCVLGRVCLHIAWIRGFSPARPTAHWGSGVWAVFWIFHFQRLYSPHPVRSSAQKTIPTGSDAGRRLGSVVARCPTRHSDSGSGLDGAEVTLVCRKASLSTSGGRKVLMRGRISGTQKQQTWGAG